MRTSRKKPDVSVFEAVQYVIWYAWVAVVLVATTGAMIAYPLAIILLVLHWLGLF